MYLNNGNKNQGGSFCLLLPFQKEHEHKGHETSRKYHPIKQLVSHLKSNTPFPKSNVYVSIHDLNFHKKVFKNLFPLLVTFQK